MRKILNKLKFKPEIKLFHKHNMSLKTMESTMHEETDTLLIDWPHKGKKALVLCDLHSVTDEELHKIVGLEYDYCFLLGDISYHQMQIIDSIIETPIFCVGGNHDTKEFYDREGFNYLHENYLTLDGITFIGIEGSSRYKYVKGHLMYSQEESLEIAKTLPKADIFLTHDSVFEHFGTEINNCGLRGISYYLENQKPILHLHGHHHVNDKYMINDTLCIACYRCVIVGFDGSVEVII